MGVLSQGIALKSRTIEGETCLDFDCSHLTKTSPIWVIWCLAIEPHYAIVCSEECESSCEGRSSAYYKQESLNKY
jgi:hypothetical protein